jgi:hypothetical protein
MSLPTYPHPPSNPLVLSISSALKKPIYIIQSRAFLRTLVTVVGVALLFLAANKISHSLDELKLLCTVYPIWGSLIFLAW